MRTSSTQDTIISILNEHHLLSMKEIASRMNVDFSTIFRNVETMCAHQLLKKIVIDKDTVKYELADHTHDHFICDDCGTIKEIALPAKESLVAYGAISDIIIHGTCKACL